MWLIRCRQPWIDRITELLKRRSSADSFCIRFRDSRCPVQVKCKCFEASLVIVWSSEVGCCVGQSASTWNSRLKLHSLVHSFYSVKDGILEASIRSFVFIPLSASLASKDAAPPWCFGQESRCSCKAERCVIKSDIQSFPSTPSIKKSSYLVTTSVLITLIHIHFRALVIILVHGLVGIAFRIPCPLYALLCLHSSRSHFFGRSGTRWSCKNGLL